MNTFCMVMLGSSMTRSPLFNVFTRGLRLGSWSAMSTDKFALIMPVATPIIIMDTTKPPSPVVRLVMEGTEVTNRMRIPTM